MNICKSLNFQFAHHHLHTEYSPFDAPVGLKKLAEYTKHLGYKTLTVTDHGTVSSWVKVRGLCKENGLKPIYGMEGYFVPDRKIRNNDDKHFHCVLIAKNNEGIKNLYQISEKAWREGYYSGDPRFDWELLELHHEGLICTTSCVSGYVTDAFVPEKGSPILTGEAAAADYLRRYAIAKERALRLQKIFGPDLYAEVQYHALDIETTPYRGIAQLAKELGMKMLATNDVHFLKKEDSKTQEIMMGIRFGKCVKDPSRMKHETNQLYLKSPEEMIEMAGGKNRPAVMGALEIADQCTADLPSKTQFPSVPIPKEYRGKEMKSDLDYLIELAREGMERIGKVGNPVYEARFNEEIGVITKLRDKGRMFDRYFLVVHDYVSWAWKNGIRVGVGRGSGCGSLILYCLRITGLDPIPYDLLFERFLDEDRNEMPDIDIDFDNEGGARVIAYLCKKWGDDHVARICNFHMFHVASAIKTAFRAFDPGNNFEQEQEEAKEAEQARKVSGKKGIQLGDKKFSKRNETSAMANLITKMLPRDPGAKGPSSKLTLLKSVFDKDPENRIYAYTAVPELMDWKRRHPDIFALAEHLEGLLEKRGMHAAGVLITEEPLVNVCPQQLTGSEKSKKKELATAFDMIDVEKIGGIKFDILQTKVLSVLTYAVDMIQERYNTKIDIDNLTTDDRLSLAIFERGDTTGIFQFESDGMRGMLKSMKSISFDDVIAANALFRPGPMENIPSYCRRKVGAEPISYPTPALEPVLKPTLGIIVYQEQVIKAVRVLAGFTASEADKVRKAMGKKKKEILDEMKEKFIKGCDAKQTCSKPVAASLWASMEKFGAYAFNKSHAAGYSYTAYQCAWLKAHYPEEFMAAQLTVEGADGAFDTIFDYERAAEREMGLKMLKIDVNQSKQEYRVIDRGNKKCVLKGFYGVKEIGQQAPLDIIAGQPYKDMFDFCLRAESGATPAVVKNEENGLLKLGAFESFLPRLSMRLKRDATLQDLENEYNDQSRRANKEKRQSEAIKEERKGIAPVFSFDEEEPAKQVPVELNL